MVLLHVITPIGLPREMQVRVARLIECRNIAITRFDPVTRGRTRLGERKRFHENAGGCQVNFDFDFDFDFWSLPCGS
jgi:hypothetical protein